MLRLIPGWKDSNGHAKNEDVFNHFFSSFFDEFFNATDTLEQYNSFKVDILEGERYYLLEADLPGFNEENLEIDYDQSYLTITTKKEEKLPERKEQFVRRERQYGVFSRSFYIENIQIDKIETHFNEGVLTVKIPKLDFLTEIK